jgi:hypothetical protein
MNYVGDVVVESEMTCPIGLDDRTANTTEHHLHRAESGMLTLRIASVIIAAE